MQATEALRHVEGGVEGKIIRRAEMIDRDRRLSHTLEQVRTGSFLVVDRGGDDDV